MTSSANIGQSCRYVFKCERSNGMDRLDVARVDEDEEFSQESIWSTLVAFLKSEEWKDKPCYDLLVKVLGVGEVNGSE